MTSTIGTRINPVKGMYALEQLRESIREMKIFLDSSDPECDVPRTSREGAAGLYLATWVLQPMEEALRLLEGREPEHVLALRDEGKKTAPKISKASTRHVFRNLQKEPPYNYDTYGESFPMGSLDAYRRSAERHLRDKSELTDSTINSADWEAVYAYFKAEHDAT